MFFEINTYKLTHPSLQPTLLFFHYYFSSPTLSEVLNKGTIDIFITQSYNTFLCTGYHTTPTSS